MVRTLRNFALAVAVLALAFPSAAIGGNGQSVLSPESHPARDIASLWWWMLGAASLGFGVVVMLLFLGWLRRNRTSLPFGGRDRVGTSIVVGLGVAVPIIVLSLLFVVSDLLVAKTTEAPAASSTQMTIRVVGHQWFWEVRYPGRRAVTANEIHIPVHTRVNLIGTTADVIHSFWVPELNRKIDLIPGMHNRILLEADHAGRYRGQCAEFCGLQHAHMSLYVFAEPPAAFRAWLADMSKPARKPTTAAERRGRSLFLRLPCSGCHTISGTSANGTIGPDLTHVGSRTTLAALTIPNDSKSLARWIENPKQFKPGSRMPGLDLSRPDLEALVSYLESLK
jgi:cytochrome c oxidase subunit 2